MAAAFSQPHLLLIVAAVLLVVGSTARSSSPMQMQCHEEDESALLAVSSALGSPYGGHLASSWTPDTFCCDWYAVDCDNATGRVVGLTVVGDAAAAAKSNNNNLTTIPDAIANLTGLRTLVLRRLPGLSGAVPDSLALLTGLTHLTISSTGVSGPLPAFLAQLTDLTLLDLSFNFFSGSIPATLADLPALCSIDLSRNRLSGPVPSLLLTKCGGSTQAAAYLRLSHNNFSGGIPAGFAGVGFAHLDLSRNAFTGDASHVLGKGKPLQHLDLSRNALGFSLTAVGLPEQLSYVDLSHNAIRGRIPAQVADLAALQVFNVSYNRMCGVVPTGGNMPNFDAYSYQHNRCLCGTPLPACGGHRFD